MDTIDFNDNFTLSEETNGPLLAAVIGLEMVAGLITNSFVLILTHCYLKDWKQPSNIFLTNMLLNNLIIVIFTLPFSFITCATGKWIFGNTLNQKVVVCKFSGYITFYSFVGVTLSLVLLSFDRFFFIVKALQYNKYMTVSKAVIIVALSWALTAILASPPLYGLGRFEFVDTYGTCVFAFENEVAFSIYIFTVCSCFIVSIIVTSTWTFCYIKKYLKKRSDRKTSNSEYNSQKRNLIGLFGTLIIIHILCYSLLIITSAIGSFIFLPYHLYTAAFVILSLITTLSPLAQAYFRTDVRNLAYRFIIKIGNIKPRINASRQIRFAMTPSETTTTTVNIDESEHTSSPTIN